MNPFTGLPELKEKKLTDGDKEILLDDDKWLFDLALKLNIPSGGGGAAFSLADHTTDELSQGSTNLYSQWDRNTYNASIFLQPKTTTDALLVGHAPDAAIFSAFSGISAIFNGDVGNTNQGTNFYGVFAYGAGFIPLGGAYLSGNSGGTAAVPTQLASNSFMGLHAFTAFDGSNWTTSNGTHTVPGLYAATIGQAAGGLVDGHYYLGSLSYKMLGFRSDTNAVYLNFNNLTATTTIGSAAGTAVTVDGTTGNATFGFGIINNYVAKTGTYAIATSDYLINCTANTFTVTLPTAVGVTGQTYVIKNSGTGVITIATTSSQTIDGVVGATLTTQYSSITVMSNGANWIII